MVTKTVFETYDKAKIDELLANAGGGEWVQLTNEEYYDGSVVEFTSATTTYKKDVLVVLHEGACFTAGLIPKGTYGQNTDLYLPDTANEYPATRIVFTKLYLFTSSQTVSCPKRGISLSTDSSTGVITLDNRMYQSNLTKGRDIWVYKRE